jgi:hypothetical protein
MKTRTATILLATLIAGPALAQPGAVPHQHQDHPTTKTDPQGVTQTQITPAPVIPAQPAQPRFESLARRGPDGKVVRLEGITDILALQHNPLVDEASKARIRPAVKEWLSEVEQLAVDNLDFIEQIEPYDGSPGIFTTAKLDDTDRIHYISQFLTQLLSAGPLSATLETRGVLTREQSRLNQEIAGDYLQQVMNEIMAEKGIDNNAVPEGAEAQIAKATEAARFLYYMTANDALQAVHQMQFAAARNIDAVVTGLSLPAEVGARIRPAVEQVKAARTDEQRRQAVRAVMKGLDFLQRQTLLRKARELEPINDPLAQSAQASSK